MAIFEVQGPDGTNYEIDAPDEQAAMGAFQQMIGSQQPDAVQPASGPFNTPSPPSNPPRQLEQRSQNPMGAPDWMMQAAQESADQHQAADEAIGTWLNRAGESMTLGLVGDEASAGAYSLLPGRTYEGELERFRQNEEDMSTAGRLSADLAGAVIPGAGLAGAVSRAATPAMRVGRAGLAGAGAGAAYGFAEGEGGEDNRLQNAKWSALIGGGVGVGSSALGRLLQGALNKRETGKAISGAARSGPTSDALRAEGNALYRQVDDAGVQIRPEAFDQAKGEIRDYLRNNTGFDELPGPGSLTPNSSRVMQIMDESGARMAQEPTAALPFRSLDQMRRQAGAASGNVANKSDQKAGVGIIEGLDEFVQRLGPDDIVPGGDVETLKTAITKARDVWGRMSRSQLVDDAIEAGDDYLGGASSGIRNQFKNILRNKKLSAGFSDAEKAALRSVINGNALERMITLAGSGLSQLGSIGGGAAIGSAFGPIGGTLGAMGGAALATGQRKLSEAVTRRAAERARSAIASGQLPQNVSASPALANLLREQLLGQSGNIGDQLSPVQRIPRP